jgi:glycosyltransferase involved in cell wall biosynthesis
MTEAWKGARRLARRTLRRPARFIRRRVLPHVVPAAPASRTPAACHVRVVGLLSSASGLGKSARLCIESLRDAGYSVSSEDVGDLFASDDGVPYPPPDAFQPGGFSLYHLNPSMLLPGIIRSGLARYYRSYNIGYWAWELEALPPEWVTCLRFVHAVIVPSRFCQAAVRRYTSKPVAVVPHPVSIEHAAPPGRPRGTFRVVNIFRFGSSFIRKNPIAAVEAFRLAFNDDSTAQLVLKTCDGARFPDELSRLTNAIGARANIALIDEVWPEERIAELMRSADAYLSLHRSEGFGLPLAEAIMTGVPVIATNWSGNTDFCKSCYPIDYRLVPFHDSHGEYDQVGKARWAEPSVTQAAQHLRCVRADRASAQARAQAAKTDLIRHIAAHDYQSALAAIVSDASASREAAISIRI